MWSTQLTAEKRAIMVIAEYSKLMDCLEVNSRAGQKQRLPGYNHDIILLPVADISFFSQQLRAADF